MARILLASAERLNGAESPLPLMSSFRLKFVAEIINGAGDEVSAIAIMLFTEVPLVGRPLFVELVTDELATSVGFSGTGKPLLGVVTTGVVTTGVEGDESSPPESLLLLA